MSRRRAEDPGPLRAEELYRPQHFDFWPIAVFIGLVVFGMLMFVLTIHEPRPHCPDGYALAGGGLGGRLHCVPGAEVEYR